MNLSEKFIKASDDICDFYHPVNAPYFRKSFTLSAIPSTAEITICGEGFYRLWVNGKDITKGPLAPYISNPDDVDYYDTYAVETYLTQGENVIGVLLGNGMRNAWGGFIWEFEDTPARGPVCLSLDFSAKVGNETVHFEADETFKTHPSPITSDDERMGCRYDARLEIPGWNEPNFDDSQWANALPAPTLKGEKRLCPVAPIVTLREIKPVSITWHAEKSFAHTDTDWHAQPQPEYTRKNVYVFDFGVNTAGVTRLSINGKPGQKITIRHGEQLIEDGFSINSTIFFNHWKSDKCLEIYAEYGQVDQYICKGGEETFVPDFNYSGFRYCFVEGLEKDQVSENTLVLLEQSSQMEERAGFTSANPVLNKLQENTRRSDRANFFYFPTDCPHREKNGWTGDASTSAEHFLLNLDMKDLLKEWLYNIRLAQRDDGALPGIVPTLGWGFDWGNGPAWDAVCINLPYYIYRFDGDTAVIKDNKDLILRYLRYAQTRLDDKGLAAYGLGDWCDPFVSDINHPKTPLAVTDTLELTDITEKASFLFREIGDTAAAEETEDFHIRLKEAFRRHLIDFSTMTVAGDHQTAQADAIRCKIFTESELPRAQKRLVEIIHRDGDISTCGMIGVRHIYHVLADMGEIDLAYQMITNKGRTGYGYWIEHGATSMWENFPSIEMHNDSHNHHFMGDISSFMIQKIAGVRPNPNRKGKDTFIIAPLFPTQLEHACAYYISSLGELRCAWEKKDGAVSLTVTVPKGMKGNLILDGVDIPLPAGESHFRYDPQKKALQ